MLCFICWPVDFKYSITDTIFHWPASLVIGTEVKEHCTETRYGNALKTCEICSSKPPLEISENSLGLCENKV